jgi:hypothetical protein
MLTHGLLSHTLNNLYSLSFFLSTRAELQLARFLELPRAFRRLPYPLCFASNADRCLVPRVISLPSLWQLTNIVSAL